MLGAGRDLSQELVQGWHWNIFRETKPDIAGRTRRHGVRIAGSRSVPPPPVELQPRLNEFFDWYVRARSKTNAVELAGLVHLKFVTMHPFSDGNGRIGRLMMNLVLHRRGYPMLNIEYNGRSTYYNALERSQLGKDDRPFLNWFFRRYKRENERFLMS
jgi:Fic family protein